MLSDAPRKELIPLTQIWSTASELQATAATRSRIVFDSCEKEAARQTAMTRSTAIYGSR